MKKEIFFKNWIFNDNKEVYKHCCEHFGVKESKEIVEGMNLLLGKKINSKPIILKDKIFIYILAKK